MKRILLLVMFLASGPTWAAPPEDVVRRLYDTHNAGKSNLELTLKKASSCFTPGFLAIIDRAMNDKLHPRVHVDWDFLVHSQMGWKGYKLGKATITGKEAVVPIEIEGTRMDFQGARILLTDVGNGFQIRDILWTSATIQGQREERPPSSTRAQLTDIGNGIER